MPVISGLQRSCTDVESQETADMIMVEIRAVIGSGVCCRTYRVSICSLLCGYPRRLATSRYNDTRPTS